MKATLKEKDGNITALRDEVKEVTSLKKNLTKDEEALKEAKEVTLKKKVWKILTIISIPTRTLSLLTLFPYALQYKKDTRQPTFISAFRVKENSHQIHFESSLR
jgi:hypothetical protein